MSSGVMCVSVSIGVIVNLHTSTKFDYRFQNIYLYFLVIGFDNPNYAYANKTK